MIYSPAIQAVDPSSLAEVSGATKIRRFAAPTPPVVRPFLLTSQLGGASCCSSCLGLPPDYGRLAGLRGLGQDGTDLTTGDPSTDPNTVDPSNLQVPSQGSGNISVLQTAANGQNFIPTIGPIDGSPATSPSAGGTIQTVNSFVAKLESWIGIGAGRREADIIVPIQNQMMQVLGGITNQILIVMNPPMSTLLLLYRQVWAQAVSFQEFVLLKNFTDRRASGQALNTVMPYLDGTCGYPVPIGRTATPGTFNCLSWGAGTIGGVGQNGMLGAIARAIVNAGGTVPTLPDIHQTANTGISPSQIVANSTGILGLPATIMGVSTPLALAIGVGALFLYKKGHL
jgi:hypothetical protein